MLYLLLVQILKKSEVHVFLKMDLLFGSGVEMTARCGPLLTGPRAPKVRAPGSGLRT